MTTTSTPTTAPYTRGTKTARITTAALAATPGTWVLTVDAAPERKALLAAHGITSDAEVNNPPTKTGTTLRQVERAEAVLHTGGRRAQRTYTLHFTDGSYAHGSAPATTWTRVDAPAVEEAPAAEVVTEAAPAAELTEDGAPTAPVRVGARIADAVQAATDLGLSAAPFLRAKLAARKATKDGTRLVHLTVTERAALAQVARNVEGTAAEAVKGGDRAAVSLVWSAQCLLRSLAA